MKITMPASALAEALASTIPFADTDKTRPMLRTVHVMPSSEGVVFAATDRYALAQHTVPVNNDGTVEGVTVDGEPADGEDGFSVPLDLAKSWQKMAKGGHDLPAEIVADDAQVSLTIYGQTAADRTEGYKWVPNHRRMFPNNPDGTPHGQVAFSAHHLAKFHKAVPGAPLVFTLGETNRQPVLVTTPWQENFRAIIMPVRTED